MLADGGPSRVAVQAGSSTEVVPMHDRARTHDRITAKPLPLTVIWSTALYIVHPRDPPAASAPRSRALESREMTQVQDPNQRGEFVSAALSPDDPHANSAPYGRRGRNLRAAGPSFSRCLRAMGATAVSCRPALRRDRFPYRLLLLAVPLHAVDVLRYEIDMARIRLTHRRTDPRFRPGMNLLVNIGCGESGQPGWVNVDAESSLGVTCVYDCRRRVPLHTDCARAIFTEHLLEHLDYDEEAPVFLAECRRVLHPGGIIRIVVPDGRKYMLAYASGGWDVLRAFTPLADIYDGSGTPMEVVNAHFRQGGQHRFSYDFETLQNLLLRCGFVEVKESAFGQSELPELAIDHPARASESLYVEATVP